MHKISNTTIGVVCAVSVLAYLAWIAMHYAELQSRVRTPEIANPFIALEPDWTYPPDPL